jgi:hypothetical protein
VQRQQDVHGFVEAALECSLFLSPRAPGLTYAEVIEAGTRVGFLGGELGDALRGATTGTGAGHDRFQPRPSPLWDHFHFAQDPDYRNLDAFDFVCVQLRDIVRAEGAARAAIGRDVLVERAVTSGLPSLDTEAAITILLLANHLVEKDGTLRFAHGRETYPTPREQRGQGDNVNARRGTRETAHTKAYPIVKSIIETRTDGRPLAAEPLDAFSDQLERLGYAPFRLWWKQTLGELRRQDSTLSPVSTCVLSAALVEGALTFVVKHGRTLGAFASDDFDGDPKKWKIEDLVKSAAGGGSSAILDPPTRSRTDLLIKTRQRIHAGRMLSEYPGGAPDLRPEEARDAKTTADVVVRRILDWLQKNPPTT